MDVQRTAESLARSLDGLDQIISANEFRANLSDDPAPSTLQALDSQYKAAEEIRQHHELPIQKLSDLTSDLGLMQANIPSGSLTKAEEDVLKLLVLAHSIEITLWLKITGYQDEINPLRESRRKGGKALLDMLAVPTSLCYTR